ADEQESHALAGLLLQREDGIELLLGDVTRAQEQIPEPVVQPPPLGLRGDDRAAAKRDRDRVVVAPDRENTRPSLQTAPLEELGQLEDLERALKPHRAPSFPRAAPAARRSRPARLRERA